METPTVLRIPPLAITVYTVEDMSNSINGLLPTSYKRTEIDTFSHQFLQEMPVSESNYRQSNCSGVQVPPDNLLCIGCPHPTDIQSTYTSEIKDNMTLLNPNGMDVTLSKNPDHPLMPIVPGISVKLMYVSPSDHAEEIVHSTTSKTACNTTSAGVKNGNPSTSHLFTISVPLKQLLQGLVQSRCVVQDVCTSEDNNRQWQFRISLANDADRNNSQLASYLDIIGVHESWVRKKLNHLETICETVTAVTNAREVRKKACAEVLERISPGQDLPTTWDLQMSRALNISMTQQGPAPAKLDEQALEEVRIGCVTGDEKKQVFINFVNAMASTAVQIAQRADVPMVFDHSSQLAMFDREHFDKAIGDFVKKNGVDALMHQILLQQQAHVVAATKYTSDPAYCTVVRAKDVQMDSHGNGHVNFRAEIIKSKDPGEDQQTLGGMGPTSHGYLERDCEDVANLIAVTTSLLKAFPEDEFLQNVSFALKHFPPSIQQVTGTIVSIAKLLHSHTASIKQRLSCDEHVKLADLNSRYLIKALQKTRTQEPVRLISTCVCLAKSPRIGAPTTGALENALASKGLSPHNFCQWWMTSPKSGLTGHAICVGVDCTPILQTTAANVPVFVYAINPQTHIVEGTGIAREVSDSASDVQHVNYCTEPNTAERFMLQKRVDDARCLNTTMRKNILSSMHAKEISVKLYKNFLMAASLSSNTQHGITQDNSVALLRQNELLPTFKAINNFTLNASQANTYEERLVSASSMFYAVNLAIGLGSVYTLDCNQAKSRKKQNSMALDAPAEMHLVPGSPFTVGMLSETSKTIVVSSPCSHSEQSRLRALGAFMTLNKLGSLDYLERVAKLTPLPLRRSMRMCPTRNMLIPLTAAELITADSFRCGLFARSPYHTFGQDKYSTLDIESNMHGVYLETCKVTKVMPMITGTGFADSMMVHYPSES